MTFKADADQREYDIQELRAERDRLLVWWKEAQTQRDVLLAALRKLLPYENIHGMDLPRVESTLRAFSTARAAIARVEEEKGMSKQTVRLTPGQLMYKIDEQRETIEVLHIRNAKRLAALKLAQPLVQSLLDTGHVYTSSVNVREALQAIEAAIARAEEEKA